MSSYSDYADEGDPVRPTEAASSAVIPAAPSEQFDRTKISRAKNDAVSKLMETSYAKAGQLQLTKEESDALLAEFPDTAFRPGAAGKESLIYIEHADLRDRLTAVLGLGQWTLVTVRSWEETFEHTKYVNNQPKLVQGIKVYTETALIVRGCFVGNAVGDMDYYPDNLQANYGDAFEGAKTAAFRRCAKEFGIGLQAWRKNWTEGWWSRRNQGGNAPLHQQYADDVRRGQQRAAEHLVQSKFNVLDVAAGENPAPKPAPTQQPRQNTTPAPQQANRQQGVKMCPAGDRPVPPSVTVCPKCGNASMGRSQYPPKKGPDPLDNTARGFFCYTKGCAFKAFSNDAGCLAAERQAPAPQAAKPEANDKELVNEMTGTLEGCMSLADLESNWEVVGFHVGSGAISQEGLKYLTGVKDKLKKQLAPASSYGNEIPW